MKRTIVLIAAFMAAFVFAADAQVAMTTVAASNITDASGHRLSRGTLTWQPTDSNGNPLQVTSGGSQIVPAPVCANVVNGAIVNDCATGGTFQVVDSSRTGPVNMCYQVTVKDTVRNVTFPPLKCVQTQGPQLNFDSYVPTMLPQGNSAQNFTVGTLRVLGQCIGCQGVQTLTQSITVSTTSWSVPSTLNTLGANVIAKAYDSGNHFLGYCNVDASGNISFALNIAAAGYIVISSGIGRTYSQAFTGAQQWIVPATQHLLGPKVAAVGYDATGKFIGYATSNSFGVSLNFAVPETGRLVAVIKENSL